MEFNIIYFAIIISISKITMSASPLNGDSGSEIISPIVIGSVSKEITLTQKDHLDPLRRYRKSTRRKRLQNSTSDNSIARNYYHLSTDNLSDGEHEVRLHFSGVSAKQTSVGPAEGSPV